MVKNVNVTVKGLLAGTAPPLGRKPQGPGKSVSDCFYHLNSCVLKFIPVALSGF